MRRRILDTSVLIGHWRQQRTKCAWHEITPEITASWARQLITLLDTRAIVSPVLIEFLAGTQSTQELHLARAYLDEFEVIDQQVTPPSDWMEAQRLAQRIKSDGKPRQLGDCVIRAIARRLHYDVFSHDKSM